MVPKRLMKLVWILPLALIISAGGKGKSQKEIRVLIGQVDQSVAIEGDGLKLQTARKKYSMPGSKVEFSLGKGKLLYKGKDAGSFVRISGSGPVLVNGKSYPGEVRIEKNEDKFLILNYVDVEDYLEGVIKNEMSVKWPLEAL